MSTRPFLRFPFSIAEQECLDALSTTVEDIPADGTGLFLTGPQAMVIRSVQQYPGDPAPQVRPLIPGRLTFLADLSVGGTLPDWDQVVVDEHAAEYDGWATEGVIHVSIPHRLAKDTFLKYEDVEPDVLTLFDVFPNNVWYANVRITRAFLFDTLVKQLRKERTEKVRVGHPDWAKHAIAGFLSGTYSPFLRLDTDALNDDVVLHAMPEAVVDGSGEFSLEIAAAASQSPWEANMDYMEGEIATRLGKTDPLRAHRIDHPKHGTIPARHLFRSLRPIMLDAVNPFADVVLAEGPGTPVYHRIRCTRTWKVDGEECSAFFPLQTIRLARWSDNVVVHEHPIPSHGIVYVREDPLEPPIDRLNLTILGGWKYLDATGLTLPWREPGQTATILIDLLSGSEPHIQLRRPMGEQMLVEESSRFSAGLWACTYLSVRRMLRALVDNRICGGRLSRLGSENDLYLETWRPVPRSVTDLINTAFAGLTTSVNAASFQVNQPRVDLQQEDEERVHPTIVPMLDLFFPGIAPKLASAPAGAVDMTRGEAAYWIWQSDPHHFRTGGTDTFGYSIPDESVGRGGPGAVAYLGVGALIVDDEMLATETIQVWKVRNSAEFLAAVAPGNVMQYWSEYAAYQQLLNRQIPAVAHGHSPVFHSFSSATPPYDHINVLDQGSYVRSTNEYDIASDSTLSGKQVVLAASWYE